MDSELRKESDKAARSEAHSIVKAMKNGVDMSDVFHISPRIVEVLKKFSKGNSVEALAVRNAMEHRSRVQNYVDLLLAGETILAGSDDEEDETEDDILAEIAASETDGRSAQGEEESPISQVEAQGQ